jgi:hypothetical protein
MDTLQIFEDERDRPTGMSPIPIFADERNLPKRIAGLELSGVQHYPDPALGFSVAFNGPRTTATVYLYHLGLAEVSSDVRSEQLLEIFQQSYADIDQQAASEAMRDFELHTSQYLRLPPDAPEPIGLWAAFSFDPPSNAGAAGVNRRVSHLVVRADRGHFNKIRYTHLAGDGAEAANRFRAFVAEWTEIVQSVSTAPDRVHPWIDYDSLAESSDNDRSGVDSETPGDFVYMHSKASRYITLGPHLYRSQDAMGRPGPTLSFDQLDTLLRGVQQVLQWKGLTPETALEGVGLEGFSHLVDLFHFRVMERSSSPLPGGKILDRVLIEHIMHGPERQVTLFNVP